MHLFNESAALTAARSALLSLHLEIRRHPEHSRLHQKMTAARVDEREAARCRRSDSLGKMKSAKATAEALEAEQLAFIRREFGERIDAANEAIRAAGGDPATSILR